MDDARDRCDENTDALAELVPSLFPMNDPMENAGIRIDWAVSATETSDDCELVGLLGDVILYGDPNFGRSP
jgi:hypothetical protein